MALVHIAPGVVLHPVEGDRPQEGLRNAKGVHKGESLRPELSTEGGYFGADELRLFGRQIPIPATSAHSSQFSNIFYERIQSSHSFLLLVLEKVAVKKFECKNE